MKKATFLERSLGFIYLAIWVFLTMYSIYSGEWWCICLLSLHSLFFGAWVSDLGERYKVIEDV